MALTRRRLFYFGAGALLAAPLLAGCATQKVGTVTTVTLNVAKIKAYVEAGLNAAQTVETALGMFPTLAAYVVPMQLATTVLQKAADAFSAQVGDSVTVSYDDSSVKTLVDSILSAIQQIAAHVAAVISAMAAAGVGISGNTVSRIQLVHDSLETVISVFRALLTTSLSQNMTPATPSVRVALNEKQALRNLGVMVA